MAYGLIAYGLMVSIVVILYFWYRAWYWKEQAEGFEIKYKEMVVRLSAMEAMGQMKWHRDMETYYPGEKK